MKFRYARHTDDLSTLMSFYHNIIGLQKLGGFTEHNGYNGVFLGFPDRDWHIEFTQSKHKPSHHPDKDDLIVLYLDNDDQMKAIMTKAKDANIAPVTSQNPYWNEKGVQLTDPDGFGVILTTWQFG